MLGWKHQHSKLSLCKIKVLEIAQAKALCKENVKNIYKNFKKVVYAAQVFVHQI